MIAALLLLAACEPVVPPKLPADGAARAGDCASLPPVDWAGFGHGFFRSYCTSCHASTASERHGAPAGVDFDTEAGVRAQVARIRARALDEATMPVGGGVPDDELALLTVYLDCGL